jgi:hypothetical protein
VLFRREAASCAFGLTANAAATSPVSFLRGHLEGTGLPTCPLSPSPFELAAHNSSCCPDLPSLLHSLAERGHDGWHSMWLLKHCSAGCSVGCSGGCPAYCSDCCSVCCFRQKISQLLHKLFWPGPADFRLSFTFVLSITKSFSVELTKNWVSILDLFLSLWHFPDSRRQTGLQAFWEGKKQMQSALTEVRRSD